LKDKLALAEKKQFHLAKALFVVLNYNLQLKQEAIQKNRIELRLLDLKVLIF
jgi:hypothetical protein